MLRSLRLINFRSHEETTLQMEPITLMVGPAGAGKSNVFKALLALQNSIHRSLIEMFPPGLGEFHWVRSRWAKETDPIGFVVQLGQIPQFPDYTAEYVLKIADSPAGLYVLEQTLSRRQGQQPSEWVFQRRRNRTQMGEFGSVEWDMPTTLHRVWHGQGVHQDAPNVRFAKEVARALSRFGYYHLEVSELKTLGAGQLASRIGYYGENLADFIAWTKSDPASRRFDDNQVVDLTSGPEPNAQPIRPGSVIYETILREMQQLLPSLESMISTQSRTDKQGLAFKFREHNGYIAAPDMSDGTMFTLGMLCILNQPVKPNVLCVEEPETGLHPRRLRWLFEKFVALAYPEPGQEPTQILLTTHSPTYVELFKDMLPSVQVVEQKDGKTRITPLVKILDNLRMNKKDEGIGYQWATGLFEGL